MIRSTTGAQRASSRSTFAVPTRRPTAFGPRILGIALVASVIGSLATAPAVGATTTIPSGATPSSAVALTTTAIDKPWYTTERYYLALVNCTRTGGWVMADGTCRGYGSGHYSAYVKPIAYSYSLSDAVTRPYAKLLAVQGLCTHTASGDPGYRLRQAGYLHWTWGENIGCRDGYSTAKAAVLASHRVFQSEKTTGGGHWRNIKNVRYRWIGIGIWRSGVRTRLVTDFYG